LVLNAETPRIMVAAAAAMESGGARQWSEEASGIPEASWACWAATSRACWAAACVLSGNGGDLAGVLDDDLAVVGGGVLGAAWWAATSRATEEGITARAATSWAGWTATLRAGWTATLRSC
jgi:hypothetical protein